VISVAGVPSGSRRVKHAIFVAQAHGHAVHLGSTTHSSFSSGKSFLDAGHEITHFLLRIGVVEAHHRTACRTDWNSLKARRRRDGSANRRGKFGNLFFEVEQFVIKPVVFLVADHRPGFDIVGAVVPADFLHQPGVAFFGFGWVTRELCNDRAAKDSFFVRPQRPFPRRSKIRRAGSGHEEADEACDTEEKEDKTAPSIGQTGLLPSGCRNERSIENTIFLLTL